MSLIKFFCPRENAKLELEERKKLIFHFFSSVFLSFIDFFWYLYHSRKHRVYIFFFLDSSSISVRSIIRAAM